MCYLYYGLDRFVLRLGGDHLEEFPRFLGEVLQHCIAEDGGGVTQGPAGVWRSRPEKSLHHRAYSRTCWMDAM